MTTGTRIPKPHHIWDDENNINKLKDLISQGYPAQAVADEIPGTTRCAIIGKARRLGIHFPSKSDHFPPERKAAMKTMKASRQKRKPGGKKTSFNFRNPVPRAPTPSWTDMPDTISSRELTIFELKHGLCKAVTRTPDHSTKVALFCGNPTHKDSPYCAGHYYRYYQPPRPRKDQRPRPRA